MRAVRFHEYGDATVLQVEDINTPAVSDDQVLVRVVTAATNILDIALREGKMGDAFPGALPSEQVSTSREQSSRSVQASQVSSSETT